METTAAQNAAAVIQALTFLSGVVFFIWQSKRTRQVDRANRIAELETTFWSDHKETYTKVRTEHYHNKTLSELAENPEDLTSLIHYLNFFNNLGSQCEMRAIDFDSALRIFPVRISKVMEIHAVEEIITNDPYGWTGLKYLNNELPRIKSLPRSGVTIMR